MSKCMHVLNAYEKWLLLNWKLFFTSLSFFSHIKFWCAFSTHGYIQSVNSVMYKCTSWHLNNDYEKDTLCKAQFFKRCVMYSEDTLSNVSNISLFADTKHKCGRGLPLFSQQTFSLNLHVHKMFWNVMESPPSPTSLFWEHVIIV